LRAEIEVSVEGSAFIVNLQDCKASKPISQESEQYSSGNLESDE
jgi:hypothetical protein